MTRLLFLAGTSQVGSVNWRLAGAAADLARRTYGDLVSVDAIDVTELNIPRSGGGPEAEAAPGVVAFRDAVSRSDGLFVTSDEYTGTYSANLKNALAWLKRKDADNEAVLAGMLVALCGASIGGVRALRGQPALEQLLSELGATVVSQHLSLGISPDPFGPDGRLLPSVERSLLNGCLAKLAEKTSAAGAERRLRDYEVASQPPK